MQTLTKFLCLGATLALATACKKEIETVTVPTDKVYSWSEVKQLINYQRNVMRVIPGTNTLNLQETGSFEVLSPIPGSAEQAANGYYTGFGHTLSRTWVLDPLPWDVRNAVPMNADFYANSNGYDGNVNSDTVLTIYPTKFLDRGTLLHLRQLDPAATQFENYLIGSRYPFGAINRNNYLLCGYRTTTAVQENAFHLVLTKLVNPSATAVTAASTTQISSQLIRVPTPTPSQFSAKTLWAIDDYFLVWCNNAGLYKIRQDGTVKLVNGPPNFTSGPVNPTTIYKWQGTVYSIQQDAKGPATIYTSKNDGESWQQITGFNQALVFSTFYPVGDSLVGITHGVINNSLYTFRWLSANTIRLRELKNDGLGYVDFSDLAQLGDTVYLGTTNGLFKRPLSQFFESKP